MPTIDKIVDRFNKTRRLGSLQKPKGFVSAFSTFEGEFPLWTDAQIKAALKDQNRRVARHVFGPEWIPNQGPYGSCNGFAAANALTRAMYLGGKTDVQMLSGSFVYSFINGGRDQGSMLEDGLAAIQKYGTVPLTDCPPSYIYRDKTKQFDAAAKKNRAVDCYAVQTIQGLRTAGAAGFPIIVAVHVGPTWDRLDSRGISGVDNGPGNHAVCCDDMLLLPDGTEVFDNIMDWGVQHGVQGKSYLTLGHFKQTFSNHVFYAIPTGQWGET